ncbi:hypothetical protein AVEN_116474-1 [Araneus ventricosus]|uniref:Uncharacterized protein n=1 Tax=Araneus ventricosus TaxID=182803 RepID=A0A4Y2SE73_ARAVE|nr:hypothetical protein AVEN_198683-1 [Araneus ventricosus]GBN85759.1 hypothetical protein AVEN_157405-1 [Araneus ventricosus]GBN85886.1 hypothetical protein AVEN_116474-1 [Araneus ventricosus]
MKILSISLNPRMVKLRSYGLSFHKFRPRFALFLVVGTGRIDVTRGLVVSTSVVSGVMAVNSSHIKGGGVARRRNWSEFHRLQSTTTNIERLEVCQATRRGNKA